MNISVIIPAYNAESFVRKAVESALQHSEVHEVILVEDGSPDQTLKVCRELAVEYPAVRLIQHPDRKNHGASASRNLGISTANTEFIAFLDADDYYLSNRFEKDVAILSHSEHIDGVYGALGFHYYQDKGHEGANDIIDYNELTTVTDRVSPEELLSVLLGISDKARGYFTIDALTVRKRLLDRTGYFDSALELAEDTQLFIKMATLGKLTAGIIDAAVAMRGVHGNNRVTNQGKLEQYRMPLYKSLYDWGCENGMPQNALDACHDKYLVWKSINSGFLENIRFLLSMPMLYPRIYAKNDQFSRVVISTFGSNIISRAIIWAKKRFTYKTG